MTLEEFGKLADKEQKPMNYKEHEYARTENRACDNLLGVLLILAAAFICIGFGFVVGALTAWMW